MSTVGCNPGTAVRALADWPEILEHEPRITTTTPSGFLCLPVSASECLDLHMQPSLVLAEEMTWRSADSCTMTMLKPNPISHHQLRQSGSENSATCSACDSLVIELNTIGRDRRPRKDWKFLRCDIGDLLVGSQAGCQSCCFFESAFNLSWRAKSQGRYQNGWLQLSADDHPSPLAKYSAPTITALLQLPQAKPALRRFIVQPAKQDQDHKIRVDDGVPYEVAALARSWFAKCQSHHSACRRAETLSPLLPTQLIDVGTTKAPLLELIVPGKDERGRWAALSYRRSSGGDMDSTPFVESSPPFDSLRDFGRMRRLSLSSLPRTFRDAILMTRALDIRYLWIDKLCNIPDGEFDEVREAENIAHIFSNAVVTFVATASADIHGGLFHPQHAVLRSREAPPVWEESSWCDTPRTLAASANSGSNASSTTLGVDDDAVAMAAAKIEHRENGGWVTLTQSHGRDFRSEPIHKDAWALGEYLLSRRRLLFTSNGLIWGCRQGVEAELESKAICEEVWHDALSQRWTQVVEQVSTRRTGEPREKGLALAGLAKWMGQHRGDEYTGHVAGLWRNKLCTELLWCRVGGSASGKSEERGSTGPSWSWLSVNSAVEFSKRDIPENEAHTPSYGSGDKGRQQLVWKVLDCEVVPEVEGHEFGPVAKGMVTIRGPIAPVYLKFREMGHLPARDSSVVVTARDRDSRAFDLGVAVLDSVALPTRQVFCLVATADALEKFPSEGLLITPEEDCTRRGETVFRRIGMFRSKISGTRRFRTDRFALLKIWFDKLEDKSVVII